MNERNILLEAICKQARTVQTVTIQNHGTVSTYIDIRLIACSHQSAPQLAHAMRALVKGAGVHTGREICLVAPALGGSLVAMGMNSAQGKDGWPNYVWVLDFSSGSTEIPPAWVNVTDNIAKRPTTYVLIDDVSHSGDTLIRCLDLLDERHISVAAVCTVVDRGYSARPKLAQRGLQLRSLFSLSEIEEFAYAQLGSDA